ncbi:MAG: hypothetical protein IPM29_07695 [Planctomycetes bacterium]|nr:hypothetical protein [Planctomycetota bacterium]
MTRELFELSDYTLRRKVFKLLGAGFHVKDAHDRMMGYSEQKAFKMREDVRVFTDESKTEELVAIRARKIIDFSSAYDVVDSETGVKVGGARRKGFTSMIRDTWEVFDADDRPIAKLQESSAGMAMLSRLLPIVPQTFTLAPLGGGAAATMSQRFNPFVYKLDVHVPQSCELDRRLVFAVAVLIAVIEGRQE